MTQYTDGLAVATTLKTSGSLDDITKTSYYVITDAVTGIPATEGFVSGTSAYAFVRTTVYDSNAAFQEYTSFAGHAYSRIKRQGSWRSWEMLSPSVPFTVTSASQIDNVPASTLTFNPSVEIAGIAAYTWCCLHTYDLNQASGTTERRMQVIESSGGVRKTRFYNGSWGTWT